MTDYPEVLDRFEIVRVLGKGGMGTVYLARDQRLGRSVALKVLNELDSEEQRARFLREARTAAAIRHQNVATIYEVDETDEGQPYIVMEYCEGETLAQRLRRRPLDAGEFLSIARQLAAGLAAAHDTGVIHRDIKAANVIIESTGLAKILDFGLAKHLAAQKASFESTSGHFFGTLHYLSPEQARGQAADARSDLFSVGVVLYQMASGHLPFNAEAPLQVIERIRDSEPEPFVPLDPAFPPAAAKIIGKLLQKNAHDRYQSARALLEDLETIDTPTLRFSANQKSTIGRTRRRMHPMRIALIAGAFLAATAGFLIVREFGNPTDEKTQGAAVATGPIRSMAILPLANLANSDKDDFLSVGLADALVTKLQQIPSIQVRPTSAVLQFRDKKVDAKSASRTLQVDSVMEGHFLSAGDLVRVNLQLTDSRTGYSVWADTIDGKRGNLIGLIDAVSTRTLAGVDAKLGLHDEKKPAWSEPRSSNAKAYEEYLKARALNGSFVPQEFRTQIASLKKAVELDPNFAAAYADLAIALSLGTARSLVDDPNAMASADWYARQAVRLDPNLPQAHIAMGRVFVRDPNRFRESIRENLAALRLNPGEPQALWVITTYFVSGGDLQKAQCTGDRLTRIDPSSNEAKTRPYWYVNAVDPEGALQNAKFALASKETELAGHDVLALAYLMRGDVASAEREANAAAKLVPRHYIPRSLRAMVAAARGDRAASEAAIRSFEADAMRNHWAAIRIAMCYAKLGDKPAAIRWVDRAIQLGHHSWYEMIRHPWLQSLQSEPAYQAHVAQVKADIDDVRDDVIGVYQLICR
jgi:serine/threonine-protein kinase